MRLHLFCLAFLAAPALAEPLVEVTVPEITGNGIIGAKVFEARCAACHGTAGAGNDGKGPPLIHKIYEPAHHGDMAFYAAAAVGSRAHHWQFGHMPPVEGITKGEVTMVIDYIRQIQRANGIE